ncbi:hypothetical protein CSUI_008747 [Cystoisospora suis]|uniref:Uncharacterized protein n=1 Tax=Cystoisospora suis TaxID=483139 RepID=A0A2C6KLQ6_9APIC|nr:hypothetical protein CSUI_008747 [Cystoisospora suis]
MRDALFPPSSYPQSPSSSSSSSEKQTSSSSSSSSQKSFGETGRGGEGEREKKISSPRGLLSEMFSKTQKNLSSTSKPSPSNAIKTALWEEVKQAMRGVKEVFFLNIKLWLMNKVMSLLNKLIQRLLRRR